MGVATITLARPPANALGEPIITGLTTAFDRAEAESAGVVVIRSAVDGFFAAGADLTLFADLDQVGFLDYLDRLRSQIERAGFWVMDLDCSYRWSCVGWRLGTGDGVHDASCLGRSQTRRSRSQAWPPPRCRRNPTSPQVDRSRPRH